MTKMGQKLLLTWLIQNLVTIVMIQQTRGSICSF